MALANNNQLGLILQANSGLPFNIRSRTDLNQDGVTNDRPTGSSAIPAVSAVRTSTCATRASRSATRSARAVLRGQEPVQHGERRGRDARRDHDGRRRSHRAVPRRSRRRARTISGRCRWVSSLSSDSNSMDPPGATLHASPFGRSAERRRGRHDYGGKLFRVLVRSRRVVLRRSSGDPEPVEGSRGLARRASVYGGRTGPRQCPRSAFLVFGPHPDDIEIGLGGTVALHASRGDRVGLCDLTRGELGSNGTPDEREAEAEAARRCWARRGGSNLRWPDGGITGTDAQIADIVRLVRQVRPRAVAIPYWDDRHPDHRAASDVLRRAVFQSGLRRFEGARAWRAGGPSGSVSTSSTTRARSRSPSMCPSTTSASVTRSPVIDRSSRRPRSSRRRHAPDLAPLPAADREPRRPSRRPDRRAFAEGIVVKEPLLRDSLFRLPASASRSRDREHRHRLLRLGRRQRHRGDRAGQEPRRARATRCTCSAANRRSAAPSISPACRFTACTRRHIRCSASRSTCSRSRAASCTSPASARSTSSMRTTRCRTPPPPILRGRSSRAPPTAPVPRVVTTLHGTDITLVGSDRSYSETVAFSIEQSDGVTAVSQSLRADTYRALRVKRDIRVIPNFLDCHRYRRDRGRSCGPAIAARTRRSSCTCRTSGRSSGSRRWSRCSPGSRARAAPAAAGRGRPRSREGARSRARASRSTIAWRCWESRIRSCRCCRYPTSSCCRRCRRASAWPRSRRWPARCRSWRREWGAERGHRARPHRLPPRSRRSRRHGRQRRGAADRTRSCTRDRGSRAAVSWPRSSAPI